MNGYSYEYVKELRDKIDTLKYEALNTRLENHRLNTNNARLWELWRRGNDAIGKWLSGAIEDPDVCNGMKLDINTYFKVLEQANEEQL